LSLLKTHHDDHDGLEDMFANPSSIHIRDSAPSGIPKNELSLWELVLEGNNCAHLAIVGSVELKDNSISVV
jgi:hypothetical protein